MLSWEPRKGDKGALIRVEYFLPWVLLLSLILCSVLYPSANTCWLVRAMCEGSLEKKGLPSTPLLLNGTGGASETAMLFVQQSIRRVRCARDGRDG